MVQYKLYYFNFKGRGEIIRWIFAAAGQEYEDVRFEREQWPNYKSLSPTGQCPYLEVTDGSKKFGISQSLVISRFLAHRFNLGGKGEEEAAEVDMYVAQLNDLIGEMGKAFMEKDENKKKDLLHTLQTEIVPKNLTIFETRLARPGSARDQYIAKSGLTYADLFLAVVLEWLGEQKDAALAHFPHIKKLDENVRKNERIAAWLKKRPVTQM